MTILIAGSRNIPITVETIIEVLRNIKNNTRAKLTVISGGAEGTDTMAMEAAYKLGLEFKLYPAQWEKHGKAAGPMRNAEMVKACSSAIVFWNGESKGTVDTIRRLVRAKKPFMLSVLPNDFRANL